MSADAKIQSSLTSIDFMSVIKFRYDAQMKRHLKKWAIGLVVGTTGMFLVWSGYRGLGVLLGWVGWGICAYGIGGGLLELIKQRIQKQLARRIEPSARGGDRKSEKFKINQV